MSNISEWRGVPNFPNYEINQSGQVRNKSSGYIKKPSIGKKGYPVMTLRKDGKTYLKTVHRLVAEAYIPNPNLKPVINHIDGDKTNYSLNNLEWCTYKENDTHARATGLHVSDGDKRIAQYTKNFQLIKVYKSVSEASRVTGINRRGIGNVALKKKKYKTAGGFVWRYV